MSKHPLIPFVPTPLECHILKRYKRFLADMRLSTGELLTVHTANTGSMATCWKPGWKALICDSQNLERKYRYSLEMTHNGSSWIGVNTARPNQLVKLALEQNLIPELTDYSQLRPEIKIEESRLDFLLSGHETYPDAYIEVKNVSLLASDQTAQFPDAPSLRGQKHLLELIQIAYAGFRAVMLYIVQREDAEKFSPAWDYDPDYAKLLLEAHAAGVEILAYQCHLDPQGISLKGKLPLKLTP